MHSQGVSSDYRLHIMQDPKTNFQAVICVHENGRGPALGGCRFLEYNSFDEAVDDAIRLSYAMSYKAAMSDLDHDGAKAVIVRPKGHFDRQRLLLQFGHFVDSLNGKYITTVDSGTMPSDMLTIGQATRHVTGESNSSVPTPSESTALGVFKGIQAAVKKVFHQDDLQGLHFAVQGLGSVGYRLAKSLHQQGGILTVCDKDAALAKRCAEEFNARVVSTDTIICVDCDVLVPCALGRVFNNDNINSICAKIIAGAANDQLAAPDVAEELHARNIFYIPDYVINAGGLIHVSSVLRGKDYAVIQNEVEKIHDRIVDLIDQSQTMNASLLRVADGIVQQRLAVLK